MYPLATARPVETPVLDSETVSYERFLELVGEDVRAEWVAGRIVRVSPPSDRHQDISRFLSALLSHFTETFDLGVIRSAPFQMKTGPTLPGREPDLIYVAGIGRSRLKERYLEGPADLAVEIISPESRAPDRGEKFYEYEQGGVQEYWLIDPDREQAEFYRLDTRGIYQLVPLTDGVFESQVLPGLRLEAAWLWREPLPPLLDILKVWKLI